MKITLAFLACASGLMAQNASTPETPLRFDAALIDRSVNPCDNFYQYACGNWLKDNPIPADQSQWGRFSELQEHNRAILHTILEEAAKPAPSRDAVERQIGDFYYACMDEKAIDASGLAPIEPALARIRALANKNQLAAEMARLHLVNVNSMFQFSSGQDFKDSKAVIAQLDQGGLGLPDRDYYTREDAKSVETRQKYQAHVERMFVLAGLAPDKAKAAAAVVMKIETDLAKASLDNVSRRDPVKVYHKMNKAELAKLAPDFHWSEYFSGMGAPAFDAVNVAWPDFFKALSAEIQSVSLDDWKTYLIWHSLHNAARLLPTPFEDENFDFYGRTLTGAKEMRPRWKRCVDFADADLGEALGRKYVEKTFGAGRQGAHAEDGGRDREGAGRGYRERCPGWRPETKKQALIKLHAIANKIGYPDQLARLFERGDRSATTPWATTTAPRSSRCTAQLNKIGKPVDRNEWEMTPPTVNAYYDPQMNNINFPAGILQPPFFDNRMDDAVNFGGIGHGDRPRADARLRRRGPAVRRAGQSARLVDSRGSRQVRRAGGLHGRRVLQFQRGAGVHVNGKLTLGENTADNGGMRVALMALHDTDGTGGNKIDGFTPDQRAFLSFGQIWCENSRPEALRLQVQTDPHSPPEFRVIGVVENMPEFEKAFSCHAGQKMVAANACRVW